VIDSVVVIRVGKLAIVQEARFGAAASKVAMPIIHITEAHRAAIMWSQAHVGVVSLTTTQDTAAPFGALLVDVISAILLALTTIEPPLTLSPPLVLCMFIALLLCHASDGGIIDEGGTDSMMITPCHSLSVAIMGMVVVTSLIMSLYGMINMATIVCGG
jgi:hypothetical protein